MSPAAVYIKAILAALVAGLGALGTALTADGVSAAELTTVVSSTLAALGLVYAVPNRSAPSEPQQ